MKSNDEKEYAVTVVITAYNLERYINACFEDLMSQDMQNFDVLFVNDASTDNTMEMVSKWLSYFGTRLKILNLDKNTGMPSLARNAALESGLIDGEYVIFLDGDDRIEENMLSRLYGSLRECNDADVCICAYDRVDMSTGKTICTEMKGFPAEYSISGKDDIIVFINTSPWNKMWRFDVIKDFRYPAFKVGEEVSFNVRGYMASKKICFIDDVLIHYMVHGDSIISNTDESTIWKFANELQVLRQEADNEYKDVIEFIIFIHIGLSMAMRAYTIEGIDLKDYFKRIYGYFDKIEWFRNNELMALRHIVHRGLKGVCIWVALILYKLRFFHLAFPVAYKLCRNMRF